MSLIKFIICVNEGENSIKLLSYVDKYITDINKKNGMVEIKKIVGKTDIELMKKQGLGTPFMIMGNDKIVGRAKIIEVLNAFLGLAVAPKTPVPRRKQQQMQDGDDAIRNYMDRVLEDEDEENSDDESKRNKKRAQRLEEFQKRRDESNKTRSTTKKAPATRRKTQEELEPPEGVGENEIEEMEQTEDIINMAKNIPGTDAFDRKMLEAFQI